MYDKVVNLSEGKREMLSRVSVNEAIMIRLLDAEASDKRHRILFHSSISSFLALLNVY